MTKRSWDVYETPEGGARPEDRAAAGDPLPSAIQEVGSGPTVRIRRRTLVVLGVVLAAVAAAVPLALLATGGSDSADSAGAQPVIAFAPTLDQARFGTFVKALRKRVGSTRVSSFSSYEGDYSVVVPPAHQGDPAQTYYFYGDDGLRSGGDAGSYVLGRTFDLTTLDVAALERLYERAWHDAGGKVTNTSLTVKPPAESDDHWVTIYVDHPGDSFYAVDGDLDGSYVSGELID
ncbi:MAG TPA: hypothetical protein VJ847_15045 [Gemmatimonadales bacterium]|nr:hypothetical protein [Gemmatimonadales bacterium]